MIELNEWQLKMLQQMEKENVRKYIKIIDDHYYVRSDDLFYCIEDTQENREYAEDRLQEVIDDYEEKMKDKFPERYNYQSMRDEMNRMSEEIEKYKANQEIFTSMWNEDAWDKAFEEGFEL